MVVGILLFSGSIIPWALSEADFFSGKHAIRMADVVILILLPTMYNPRLFPKYLVTLPISIPHHLS